MMARCVVCEEEFDMEGARIIREGRGYTLLIGADRRFHEIENHNSKKHKIVQSPELETVGPAAAKLQRLLAKQEERIRKEASNGNE
jgi:hypothetical protein